MPTEFVRMGPEHAAALLAFAAQTWPERLQTDAFLRWRYDDCPVLVGCLALRGGECIAMVTGFERPYRIGGETLAVRELFDWYCLPRYRGSGMGVRVLRQLMDEPVPILMFGGTQDTLSQLPKLGFRHPGDLHSFSLPVGSRRVAQVLKRRAGIPEPAGRLLAAPLGRWLAPRPRRVPADGRALPVGRIGPEALALYPRARHSVVPLWRPDHLDWLVSGFASTGSFVPLYFARGDALAGWSLLRVQQRPEGRIAQIVDLFAPEPDTDLFTWMVSETSCVAAGFRPDVVTTLTSSPEVAAALARNGYRRGAAQPLHWWDRSRETLPEPIFIGGQWGDNPLWPFPSRWWTDGAPR